MLVILAILAAVLIPSLIGYIDKVREKSAISECRYCVVAAQTIISEKYGQGKPYTADTVSSESSIALYKKLAEVSGIINFVVLSKLDSGKDGAKIAKLLYTAENGTQVLYENGAFSILDGNQLPVLSDTSSKNGSSLSTNQINEAVSAAKSSAITVANAMLKALNGVFNDLRVQYDLGSNAVMYTTKTELVFSMKNGVLQNGADIKNDVYVVKGTGSGNNVANSGRVYITDSIFVVNKITKYLNISQLKNAEIKVFFSKKTDASGNITGNNVTEVQIKVFNDDDKSDPPKYTQKYTFTVD